MLCKIFLIFAVSLTLLSCRSKDDVRRAQDLEKLKQEVRDVRSDRADLDTLSDDIKIEMARMNNSLQEQGRIQKQEIEELKKQTASLNAKVEAMENKFSNVAAREAKLQEDRSKPTFELGKKLYEDGRYSDAAEVLKDVVTQRPRTDEGKKSHFLLAESRYQNKEYATAALEFSEFKKNYPKDQLVSNATYRQALCFQSMGKGKEARLFFQELIEKYPKSALAAKARQDLKRLR